MWGRCVVARIPNLDLDSRRMVSLVPGKELSIIPSGKEAGGPPTRSCFEEGNISTPYGNRTIIPTRSPVEFAMYCIICLFIVVYLRTLSLTSQTAPGNS